MTTSREKKDDLVYIQRDIEAIKITLDRYLKPFKETVKRLENDNASLRANIHRKEHDIEQLLKLIAVQAPQKVDEALGIIADPSRRGLKTFLRSWRHRLGLVKP